jgi:hypothetical protein
MDNQFGTMVACWAAAMMLDSRLDGDPSTWTLGNATRADSAYLTAVEKFAATREILRALSRCMAEQVTSADVVRSSTGDELDLEIADRWLQENAPDQETTTSTHLSFADAKVHLRDAWTAPTRAELLQLLSAEAVAVPSLTRLSRNPVHLAAVVQRVVCKDIPIVTPNVMLSTSRVHVRQPLVPAPVIGRFPAYADSWTDFAGLAPEHEEMLKALPPRLATTNDTRRPPPKRSPKIGRNEPCPCGSGRKYKHCHGR